ncbi:MAG TPA: transcription antitermination factor NusB [bacterium]
MISRSDSRDNTLRMLYSREITDGRTDGFLSHQPSVDEDIDMYAKSLFEGITDNLDEIDKKIQDCSSHWKVYRMSLVDRNILRIGCYETLYLDDVPVIAAINEAVNLAKKYGGEESGAFVNGILDHIARQAGKLPDKD